MTAPITAAPITAGPITAGPITAGPITAGPVAIGPVALGPGEHAALWALAAAVPDPELPMVTIEGLGILRAVEVRDDVVHVRITPTYSGCPAVDAIRDDIVTALAPRSVHVEVVLAPAWSTDQMTEQARRSLAEHGIAPPGPAADKTTTLELGVRCPQCGSIRTRELSRFGSTACKSLWVCAACSEPFDHFKSHR